MKKYLVQYGYVCENQLSNENRTNEIILTYKHSLKLNNRKELTKSYL